VRLLLPEKADKRPKRPLGKANREELPAFGIFKSAL